MTSNDFQKRVVQEQVELQEKIGKLKKFAEGAIFNSLDQAEQKRLASQLYHMKSYSLILKERIANFQ